MSDASDVLELSDPLAEALGALQPGERFRYRYDDVVRLAGHSCPTVAGAWVMARGALAALYPGQTPVRGDIEITMGGPPSDGALGPQSQVLSLLTGAAGDTGFGGLAGRWRRRGLLRFDPALAGAVRFRRVDTGAWVEVRFDASAAPRAPEVAALLPLIVAGSASEAQRREFAAAWQQRVGSIVTGAPADFLDIRAGQAGV